MHSQRRTLMPKIISRKQALAVGQELYYTGKTCPRGHKAERYTFGTISKKDKKRGVCIVCYAEDHPEAPIREDLGILSNYY